ncbi:MAG: hypothetical protein AAGF36_07325 [Pseudomonadota bacterium]
MQMPSDVRIYLVMVAIGGALIFAVSLVPPLTTGAVDLSAGVTQAEFEESVSQELDHCRSLSADLDCQCFAGMSGYVRAQARDPVPFTQTLDQTELARRQAAQSC